MSDTPTPRKWWETADITPGDLWTTADKTHLENLRDVPTLSSDSDLVPWRQGRKLELRAVGGIESRERRAYTMVGRGGTYGSHVEGNRTLATKYRESKSGGGRTEAIAHTDMLTVNADARYDFKSRTIMMRGQIEKKWSGTILKAASMEGAICGGAMARTIGGMSLTLAGMATGDVYIGVARAAGMRIYLAQMFYRSTAAAGAWAIGNWIRSATFVIVPVVLTPAPAVKPASLAAGKLARLSNCARKAWRGVRGAVKVGRMICPAIDILLGVLSLVLIPFGVAALIKAYKAAQVQPLIAAPRLETRTQPLTLETFTSKKVV